MKFFGKMKSYIKDKVHPPRQEQFYIKKCNTDTVFKKTGRELMRTGSILDFASHSLPLIDEYNRIVIKMYRFQYNGIAIIIFLSLSPFIGFLILAIVLNIINGVKDLGDFLTSIIVFLLLITPSVYFITKRNSSIIIDLVKGEWSRYEKSFPLSDIYGIQIISKWISGYNRSGNIFQLNIVLHDSSRIAFISSQDPEYIIKTAEILAEKLGIKILEELQ